MTSFPNSERLTVTNLVTILTHAASPGPPVRCRARPYHELVYFLEGETVDATENQHFTIKTGQVEFLPAGLAYSYHTRKPGRCIDFYFDADLNVPPEIVLVDTRNDERIAGLFRRAQDLWLSRRVGSYAECLSALYQIIGLLQQKSYCPSNVERRLEPAVSALRSGYTDRNFRVDTLPILCGMGYSNFRRLFAQEYGSSAESYLMKLRIDHACELLLTGQVSVSEAAEQSGFSDVSYFSRSFHRHTGVTPSEFRSIRNKE